MNKQQSSMNSKQESEIEVDKILEKLFTYADNKDLNINRIRNLIVNPQILRVLIHQLAPMPYNIKISMLKRVTDIYKRNSLNLCILFKRDREIMEFNHSIFDQIISFAFNIKIDFQKNQQLFQTIKPLISGYPIGCRNIKNIISKISHNFHFQSFSAQKLQLSLMILKELFRTQSFVLTEPKCFFYMYGPNSGIKMISQNTKWSLHKGMYFYVNFYLQSLQHQGMNLLNINVNDDTFELSINEQNYLVVKVFSANKISKLRKLEQKKWYFLKLAYCLRTGIIRNTYELVIHIEGEPFELRDLPMPSPTIKDNIDELVIGHQFYGKINFVAISRNQLRSWPKNGINNWSNIESMLTVNKDVLKQAFLFYSPLITINVNDNEIIYQIINKNHAQTLDNTAMHNNPFDEVDINYYGGLYTIIPFFYILRFYKYQQFKQALQEMIDLVLSLFQTGYHNIENQAINCQLFCILADFINQVDQKYITVNLINKIASFKQHIEAKPLKKQFLKSFLFKIRIDRINDVKIIQKLHNLISSFYYQQFTWALQVCSLYEIIWYTIDNFEPEKKQQCCMLHFWQQNNQGIEDSKISQIEEHYKLKCTKIKQLLKYIIKQLCSSRKYDLLLPKKKDAQQTILDYNKMDNKFTIFQFLKFQGYSICLKKILLECIQVGVEEDSQTLIKQTQLLECLYGLLAVAELRDQITPIISVLNQCSKILNLIRDPKNLQIINQIGKQLDKLYMKKYAQIRLRSKSQGIPSILPIKKTLSIRKVSNQMQDILNYNSDHQDLTSKIKTKQKDIKAKIVKLKKQKKMKFSNDKQLYDLLMSICCVRQPESGDIILIHDDCTKIINPYFKICSSKFRVKLIQMIRTTVLVKQRLQNIPSNMQKISRLDHVYRFVLSEFILRELQPYDPEYEPSNDLNYIFKNFFYIVDHMVIGMKNHWDNLYLFILRMVGLLTEAKKQIHKKTERKKEDILMACKVCVRKFILRVLKHTQKSIQNMGNMIFLIYLVVFNNHEQNAQTEHIFEYFQSLEQHFLIGPIAVKNQDEHQIIKQHIFIDQKIILAYFEGFKMEQVFNINNNQQDPTKHRKYLQNLIKAYLQLEQNNQLQDYLYKLQKVFLSKSKFKQIINGDNKGIRNIISNYFIGGDENKNKQTIPSQQIYVCQIIGLLLCLVVQSSMNTHRSQIFKQTLQQYVLFIKSFSLACSRDCLKRKDHEYRNEKIPTRIVYHLIHFLYQMMGRAKQQNQRQLLQESIYNILNFITLLMSVLSEKVGNPDSLDDVQMLSTVMQDVEQYNYFVFGVLQGIITLGEIRMYSTLSKQKGIDILNHPKMKKHFQVPPKVFLQKHIQQVVEIHKLNIQKVEKQLQQKFQQIPIQQRMLQSSNIPSDQNQFEEYRLDHARKLDLQYRNMMKTWRKVWKRLRLYHYYWSVSMDQRQDMKIQYKKFKILPYKHKFGKYTDLDGLRPILQVEPNQPWHVRKAQIQEQVKYRSKNFMANLYKKKKIQSPLKQKSFISRLLRSTTTTDTFAVQWIKHNSKRKGRVSITSQKLIFQYQSTFQKDSHVDFTSFTLAQHRPMQKIWPLMTIVNIIKRRYLMKKQCLLIQFQDSSSLIFDFLNDDSDDFLAKVEQIQLQKSSMFNFLKANKVQFYLKKFTKSNYQTQIQEATQEWSNGKISNLHYLMLLNKYSGRSYLDPVSYPVIPWVVSNFDFKQFVYRDLSKTLGALGDQKRRQFYQHKTQTMDPFNNVPPYQYGTHYSSPGVIFNFLIRISPYTQASRTLQGGRFDLSDRLFSSIKVCWHSVRHQVSDVRQLNPQFYYLPQILINIQNYDFGLTQLKQRIDNVKLPNWASNAYQFIANHRKALQNDQVSSNINNWIDLIFGFKQKGKIAKENLNLFYYLTYEDSIDLNKIEDSVQRTSIQAQIIHFGQTPSQLFSKPHPQKKFLKSLKQFSEPQKIKFLGLIQSAYPLLLLGQISENLIIFNDSTLMTVSTFPSLQIKSQVSLLRGSSKQYLYFVEDISVNNKVVLFGNNKFVAVSSYVNGDLVIYSINGKKIHQKKGTVKSVIYINKKQNLLICGCKNGLLQVYQIVYSQKELVNLIKIVSQYYMFPIQHISEGAGFFAISAGNLVIINKITRGLNYIHDKTKMQGTKMIRSFQSKRKVLGSYICTNPLYCVVFYNSLQVYIYSINGQFLKLRQIQNQVNPIIMVDYMLRQNVLALQPNGLLVLKVPQLQTACSIPVPDKQYTDMKIINDKLYLITTNGQILYLFNQKQVVFY